MRVRQVGSADERSPIVFVLAVLAALHTYIWYLESIAWTTPTARKVFGTSPRRPRPRVPAYNQGFYNLFLAVLIVAGLIAYAVDAPVVGLTRHRRLRVDARCSSCSAFPRLRTAPQRSGRALFLRPRSWRPWHTWRADDGPCGPRPEAGLGTDVADVGSTDERRGEVPLQRR